jgi:putative FmdB family regulatory protein
VPTYSYACTACEHHFDTVQKFTDPSLTDCPECSGRLRKLFSSVGIVFKGSGFYRTDSRSSSPAPSGEAPSGAPTESSSNGKSEPRSNGKAGSESTPPKSGSTAGSNSESGSASSSSTSAAAS